MSRGNQEETETQVTTAPVETVERKEQKGLQVHKVQRDPQGRKERLVSPEILETRDYQESQGAAVTRETRAVSENQENQGPRVLKVSRVKTARQADGASQEGRENRV